LKREVIRLGRLLQRSPNTPEIRSHFFCNLKRFNKIRKQTYRKFKQNMVSKLENLRTADPQEYWKLLKTMKEIKQSPGEDIPLKEWESYFKV
jgi:hypothetical protein